MAFDECLMRCSRKHAWQLQWARFRPDRVISPQTRAGRGQIWLRRSPETTCVELEQSGPLTPEHQRGHDQSRNQGVIIVLVNTVVGNETPGQPGNRTYAANLRRSVDELLWEQPGDSVRL